MCLHEPACFQFQCFGNLLTEAIPVDVCRDLLFLWSSLMCTYLLLQNCKLIKSTLSHYSFNQLATLCLDIHVRSSRETVSALMIGCLINSHLTSHMLIYYKWRDALTFHLSCLELAMFHQKRKCVKIPKLSLTPRQHWRALGALRFCFWTSSHLHLSMHINALSIPLIYYLN